MSDLALTCSGLTDLVADYMDSALDPDRALAFETHTVFCPGCRVFVTQMQETVERLHALPPVPVSAAERDELVAAFRSGT
jgi:anti-sigma factor RsiW